MTAIAARQRQAREQFGHALVKHRAIVTAGLVAQRAGEPAFTDTRRAADHQIVGRGDPVAGDELHEQRPVEPTAAAVIDILRRRLVTQLGKPQPGGQLAVVAEAPLPVEQQRQPLGMGQALGLGIGGKLGERLCHAGEPHGVEPVEGWMLQHDVLLQW